MSCRALHRLRRSVWYLRARDNLTDDPEDESQKGQRAKWNGEMEAGQVNGSDERDRNDRITKGVTALLERVLRGICLAYRRWRRQGDGVVTPGTQ